MVSRTGFLKAILVAPIAALLGKVVRDREGDSTTVSWDETTGHSAGTLGDHEAGQVIYVVEARTPDDGPWVQVGQTTGSEFRARPMYVSYRVKATHPMFDDSEWAYPSA